MMAAVAASVWNLWKQSKKAIKLGLEKSHFGKSLSKEIKYRQSESKLVSCHISNCPFWIMYGGKMNDIGNKWLEFKCLWNTTLLN